MSLAVYIGTEKFHDEQKGDAHAQPASVITLNDIANGQQSDINEEQPSLILPVFTDEALTTLENWLKKDAERSCTLAWPHPSAWLATSLQQGSRPKEALWQWSYQADLILKLYKRKRRQMTLEGYLPGVNAQGRLPMIEELTLTNTAPIYRLMAHQLTQEDSLLQQAYNYLKASSANVAAWQLPAADTVEQSLHYLTQESQQLQALKATADATQAELSSAQQSNTQLYKQLQEAQASGQASQQQVKEITERLSEKNVQLLETGKTKDALRAQLNEEQETHAKLQDHAHRIEQENAALLEQLMRVQEALEDNILNNQVHQADLEEKEAKLNWLRKKTKDQESKLEERKITLIQLKEEHKRTLEEKQKTVQALTSNIQKLEKSVKEQQSAYQALNQRTQQAQTKLQEQYKEATKQATESHQQLEQEAIEKSLIIAQLHETQEQLAKYIENVEHYQEQADNRQKTINVLKQEQQLICHQYESVTQWLRVSGHRNAAAAYRYSRPFKRALPQQLATIKQSSLFDAQWYCEQYPDVTTSGIEPAEHYLKFGAIEGRNPSEKFDTLYYLCEYSDVAVSGQNPLLHYLRYGQHEERFPTKPRQQLPAPAGQ
ncbi:hypothetical protein ACT3R7_06465 [Halomonas sp. AOP43-A1-21]